MPAIVRFPEVVEQALAVFAPYFPDQRSRRHLGEYLTGLYIAQRKTVNGIKTRMGGEGRMTAFPAIRNVTAGR